jgi:hypothetical protein
MIRFAFVLCFVVSLSALVSCKKCVSCTILDSNGNEIVKNERTCGNRELREDAVAEARIKGENLGGSANCSDVD